MQNIIFFVNCLHLLKVFVTTNKLIIYVDKLCLMFASCWASLSQYSTSVYMKVIEVVVGWFLPCGIVGGTQIIFCST